MSLLQSTHDADSAPAPEPRQHLGPRLRFVSAAPQGFGDRQNSWAWSMLWWKDHLYVGTNRAFLCAERAAIVAAFPFLGRLPFARFPPDDPELECTGDYNDLPLQAEIWRWSSVSDSWERVYQSPRDVPIPNQPGRFTAHEIGFRGMAVFAEPDGSEALYVSGVNTRFIHHKVPPPRLLRSTDGVKFSALPHDPGTFLGELHKCSFRSILVYEGRLLVPVGSIYGDGVLLESTNPSEGNNAFRPISPEGMQVFEMQPFNGMLYLGLRDTRSGYAVVKMDLRGEPPYPLTTVVAHGAYLPQPSQSVISMAVYQGRLYVGTDEPAELICINPDDSWELVIGMPRETPAGWKYPLSGLDEGLHNWLNGHLWRMQEYEGRLYIGTMNMSAHLRRLPGVAAAVEPNFGFDLYETTDGRHFRPITQNGFGDKFSFGVRAFAVTPRGLFLGSANSWHGLQIWRGTPVEAPGAEQTTSLDPPELLSAEAGSAGAILSWQPVPGAQRYRIWRALVNDQRRNIELNPVLSRIIKMVRLIARFIMTRMNDVFIPPLSPKVWIPEAYHEIGSATQPRFVDDTVETGQRYLYYVEAEGTTGERSAPSNLAPMPSLAPPLRLATLEAALAGVPAAAGAREAIVAARRLAEAGDAAGALAALRAAAPELDGSGEPALLLTLLARRVELWCDGLLTRVE
jgi:hypothetical protein